MRKTVYETNFDRITKLDIIIDGKIRDCARSKSCGFMDLVVERIPHLDNFNTEGSQAFSIAHYFEQNGDLCKDPEMVLFLHPELNEVEAHSFQQDLPPLYQEVFPAPRKVCLAHKKELNNFLRHWLNNLINQRHGINWENDSEAA